MRSLSHYAKTEMTVRHIELANRIPPIYRS